jgi:hypothetical protein
MLATLLSIVSVLEGQYWLSLPLDPLGLVSI